MSNIERKAASAGTPSTATLGAVRRTGVTTAEVCAIPAQWLGCFVDFDFYDTAATTNIVGIRFGTADTVTVDLTTATAKTGAAFDTGGTTQPHIVLGHLGSKSRFIDSTWTHFAFICSAATGKLGCVLTTAVGA